MLHERAPVGGAPYASMALLPTGMPESPPGTTTWADFGEAGLDIPPHDFGLWSSRPAIPNNAFVLHKPSR
jgi:hypothetical protein